MVSPTKNVHYTKEDDQCKDKLFHRSGKQKKEEKPCGFSSVVAGGGLEPPASGL